MFSGIYVPVVTPFKEDSSVDVASLSKLAERIVADGAKGLLPLGTTGEASALNAAERLLVVETCAKAVAGTSTQLVIGAGTNSTATTLERIQEFGEYSPDGFLIVTPYYVRPSEQGIIEHFSTVGDVAASMNAELMLYNIPARTGRYVSTEGLLACANHKNITGVKQAVGSIDEQTINLVANAPQDFSVLCGDDKFMVPLMLMGAKGAVAATSHFATKSWVDLYHACADGEVSRAVELHEKLLPVVSTAFAEPNPTVIKGALAAMGEIESDFVRLPLVPGSKEAISSCVEAIRELQ